MPTPRPTNERRAKRQHHTEEPRPSPKDGLPRGKCSVSEPCAAETAVEEEAGDEEGQPEEQVTKNFTFFFNVFSAATPDANNYDAGPGNSEGFSADQSGLDGIGSGAVRVAGRSDNDVDERRQLKKLSGWDGRTKYPKPVATYDSGSVPHSAHGWWGRNAHSDWDHDTARSGSGKDDRTDGWGRHVVLVILCVVVCVALAMIIAYSVTSAGQERHSGNSEQDVYPPLVLPGPRDKVANASVSEELPTTQTPTSLEWTVDETPMEAAQGPVDA